MMGTLSSQEEISHCIPTDLMLFSNIACYCHVELVGTNLP